MSEETSVVIVGAGLAGLVCARELRRAGVDVLVLEAADRVGGRALAETSALGSRLDLGGQWVGADHHKLMALADEFGLTRYEMETSQIPVVLDGDRRLPLAGPAFLTAVLGLAAVGVVGHLGRRTERWNDTTLEACLRRIPGRKARRLLELVALISWTCDLDRTSLHAAARLIRLQGGLHTMLATRGGAQDALIAEGAGTIAERLADELGDRVRTGRPVTAIEQGPDGVTVRTSAGEVRARKVAVTVPAPMTTRIAFDPPLPPERSAAARDSYMGIVHKAVVVYDRPFWRERGGGEMLVLGSASAVFDSTAPGGPGHLTILVGGPPARELDALDPEARRRALLEPLVARLGTEVLEPAGYHEKSWHMDEHAGGGYLAMPVAGSTAAIPPLACEPVGDLHWAGSETDTGHPGYLDGAIASGLRAAGEVAQALET